MDAQELKAIIEAMIFVAEEPLSVSTMTLALEDLGVSKKDIEEAIELIKETYNNDASSGIQLTEVAGGYHLRTKPNMASWIQKLNVPRPVRLSQPAMETLAIVAYRQPVVRADVEDIRGVDSGGVLKTLLERGLIRIIGKREEPGSPLVYGTTKEFLETFNLKGLNELPPLKSYEELDQMKGGVRPADIGIASDTSSEKLEDLIKEEAQVFEGQEVWEEEDHSVLSELESEIKQIRRLERDIFPKKEENITAIPNPDAETKVEEKATDESKPETTHPPSKTDS